MNRAKMLMFAALLAAFAGFLTLSQSSHAGHEEMLARAGMNLAVSR
jgi:hypothetical protein